MNAREFVSSLEPRWLLSHTPTALDFEQYMVELVNRARANPTAEAARVGIALNEGLAAGTITTDAKQPLAYNASLDASARGHSQWMLDNQKFQHEGANNDSPQQRMVAAGYVFELPSFSGENIAERGSNDTINQTAFTAQQHDDLFIDDGIAGRGHRTNILNPNYREMGAGVAVGTFQGFKAQMVTTDFASSGTGSFLTGVAYADTVTADHFYTPGEGIGGLTITATRQSDSQTFTATTSSAGGYELQLSDGTYDVTTSGGGLSSSITVHNVVMAGLNVKQDFVPGGSTGGTPSISVDFTSKLPATLKPGDKTVVTIRFRNTGTATYTGTVHPAIFFSKDATIDSSDYSIAHTTTRLSLAPGKSASVTFNVTSPVTLADGKYRILAEDGSVPIAGTTTTVHIIPPTANLAPTFAGAIKKSKHGTVVPFSLLVKNSGNGAAVGTVTLNLSLKPAAGGAGVALPWQTGIAVNVKVNGTATLKRSITLPPDLKAGSYKLIAALVATLPIKETPTKDNTATSAAFVVT